MLHGVFTIDLVGILLGAQTVLPFCFYQVRNWVPHPVESDLTLSDYYIICCLMMYLVIGSYQQNFWTKKNKRCPEIVMRKTAVDRLVVRVFTANENWVYVYNGIYYAVIGGVIISVRDYKHFAVLYLGGVAILSGLTVIWWVAPTVVEPPKPATSSYYLSKTQAVDLNLNNSCPSAHCAIAMYSFYLLRGLLGGGPAAIIPILVSISCITTGQHVAYDAVAGVLHTAAVYNWVLKPLAPNYF